MNAATSTEPSIGAELSPSELALVAKYNRPGPRYTSYPTVPEWSDRFGPAEFEAALAETNADAGNKPLSLYVHIPFCDSLCLYCACTTVITKKHEVAAPYLERLKHEIRRFGRLTAPGRPVEQIHLGGGTPTYFNVEQLQDLMECIGETFTISPTVEAGVELDPRATSPDQCRALRRLGFNRVSLGVQDFDPLVQQAVHRIQSFEMVNEMTEDCRSLGFESVNFDLIYGLPRQTEAGFRETVEKVIRIRPDRIAVFSYAHVPWLKRQQKILEKHLPPSDVKYRLLSQAARRLTEAGYRHIGMDHFALENDELCRAQDARTLHRNFQGYTTKADCDLYGLGMSSISLLGNVYAQNRHTLSDYSQAVDRDEWATMRGVRLTAEDVLRRAVISRILCHAVLVKSEIEREFGIDFKRHFASELERLGEFETDGLVRLDADRVTVTSVGRTFIRNVAMVFDAYLKQAAERRFSKTL